MAETKISALALDPKRYYWLISLAWGFLPLVFMYGAHRLDMPNFVWFYFLFIFFVMPAADLLLGEDSYNPPESEYVRLRDDPYYKWVGRITALVPYAAHLTGAWYLASHEVTALTYFGFSIAAGYGMGLAVNASHEVGHRRSKVDHLYARLGLIPSLMGHFRIEHNYGHHIEVATPEDSATARMGQSYYGFVFQEIPGGYIRAWRIERDRLIRKGKSPYSLKNEVVLSALYSLVYYSLVIALFGVAVLPFLLISALNGNLLLSSANYIEHYGLLRSKLENGKYEACQPRHSWNSNRFLSNLLILHLERHSDHHANAQRPFQCLRHYDDVPQLPAGYLPMFVLSWMPPLWFKVMDPLVADWAGGDMDKVLIKPSKEEKIRDRWHNPQ